MLVLFTFNNFPLIEDVKGEKKFSPSLFTWSVQESWILLSFYIAYDLTLVYEKKLQQFLGTLYDK